MHRIREIRRQKWNLNRTRRDVAASVGCGVGTVSKVLERAVAAELARLSGSCAEILMHREAVWTFVTHEGVEPTDNYAERALRAFVLWRRWSFGR